MRNYGIPNLNNACRVLKALANEREGMLLSELVRRFELPHTSALRIVATLCDAGFLQRSGNRYKLGTELIPPGQQALARQVATAADSVSKRFGHSKTRA